MRCDVKAGGHGFSVDFAEQAHGRRWTSTCVLHLYPPAGAEIVSTFPFPSMGSPAGGPTFARKRDTGHFSAILAVYKLVEERWMEIRGDLVALWLERPG